MHVISRTSRSYPSGDRSYVFMAMKYDNVWRDYESYVLFSAIAATRFQQRLKFDKFPRPRCCQIWD